MVQKKLSGSYWQNIIGQMKEKRFENVERLPAIGAKKYFQHDDLSEERKQSRMSETVEVRINKENVEPQQAEFLTERMMETSMTGIKLSKKPS
jgi:hypothetical protein